MPIEINALESKRFGIVAAKVTDPEASPEAIDREAAAAGADMATTRVDVGDLPRVHALEAAGYRLMDTLVYHARSLEELPEIAPPGTGLSLRRATPADAQAVGALARAAFSGYFGHYHADPRLDDTAADAAYVEWAETSTAQTAADAPVLLAHSARQLAGFLTMRRDGGDEFEIVLNAVHPDSRGKGVYTALVVEAMRVAREAGAGRMTVSTQINNYPVQRVWARLGFVHTRSLYTFHKWFSG